MFDPKQHDENNAGRYPVTSNNKLALARMRSPQSGPQFDPAGLAITWKRRCASKPEVWGALYCLA